MRWALGVEYDGSPFHGWQLQEDLNTVQLRLEQAVSRVANQTVRVVCAGRTDTGVHGAGQVVHFDSDADRTPRNWVLGCNANLPPEININWACPVPDHFHARFAAISRSYRYIILNRATRSAIWQKRATWTHYPLNEKRMQQAAQCLVGTHDFSSYRALGCQAKSPVRTLTRLIINREGNRVLLDVTADGFLHHMVRNIAGVLMSIGRGDRPVEWAREVLELRDRTLGGVTAPPQGLYLLGVGYPEEYHLPEHLEFESLMPPET
ncbi:MAG: tRNA pseudouridine(38-40) synthase TruA [Gammaproteobacteria bacterium]|nr:tRNA pseudouridine(38-40) synthase TruA [Gammaproteobacteria bacterium]